MLETLGSLLGHWGHSGDIRVILGTLSLPARQRKKRNTVTAT